MIHSLHQPGYRFVEPSFLLVVVACLLSILLALSLPFSYYALLLPPAAFIAMLLIASPMFRLAFLVVGGMAVLQTSDQLDETKMLYLAGAVLAVACAYSNRKARETEAARVLRPLCAVAMPTTAFLLATSLIALANGTSLTSWTRDVAPYLLASSIPLVALDAASDRLAPRFTLPLFVLTGLLATVSFFLEWADVRRGFVDLPLDRFLLPTSAPAIALFFYASAVTLLSPRLSFVWSMLTLLIPVAFFLTGTRAMLLLLLGPTLLLFVRETMVPRALGRLLLLTGAGAMICFVLIMGISADFDVQRLTQRIGSAQSLLGDPESDRSYLEREAQTEAAWEKFLSNPIAGAGPGSPFDWSTPWRIGHGFNVDSGLSFLSKFGVIGATIFVAWALCFVATYRKIGSVLGQAPIRYVLPLFLAYAIFMLPLANPLEDKGFSFTVLLLLVLAVTTWSAKAETRATGVLIA